MLSAGMVLAALLSIATSGAAQAPATILSTDAGRAVSTAFLVELTNPTRTVPKYRVGVVYADRGIGMLISPKGSPLAVEYIAGESQETASWSRALVDAAIGQVRNPQGNDFRFHVVRRILTAGNCAALATSVVDFYAGLEQTLSAPVLLADPPPIQRGIASHGGDVRIQVTVASAVLSLGRMGEMLHPLSQVLDQLQTTVLDCAKHIDASTEQDYAFSYQQANLVQR
jgi:hypothetical protein